MSEPLPLSHKCFGCGKEIADHERHIHVGLDDWGETVGLEPTGLGDMLTFAFCEACTQSGGKWHLEAHEIEDED